MTWTSPEISEADDTPLVRQLLEIIRIQGDASGNSRTKLLDSRAESRNCESSVDIRDSNVNNNRHVPMAVGWEKLCSAYAFYEGY